jgi:hypothetical protein
MQKSPILSKIITLLLILHLRTSDVYVPDEVYDYKNETLESQGYELLHHYNLHPSKYQDHFNEEPQMYLLIYIQPEHGKETYDLQKPSKMAFEIFPKSATFKSGKSDHVTSKDYGSETKEFAFTIENDMMSLIKVPRKIYDLNSRIISNNCLSLLTFISYKEEAANITVSEDKTVVYLDFGEMENGMYREGWFKGDVNTLLGNTLYFNHDFDSSLNPYVNLFCPFWFNSESLSMEIEFKPVMLSEVPLLHGRDLYSLFYFCRFNPIRYPIYKNNYNHFISILMM